jgi:hypothetical protein
MSAYAVVIEGLDGVIGDLKNLPAEIAENAKRAINSTLRTTRAESARQIFNQVNFGASYLNEEGRFAISKFASQKDLSGTIRGRDRATSLARYSTKSGNGVFVDVKQGVARRSSRMFFLKLKSGTADIDTKFNMGLAVRLKAGENVTNKRNMVQLSKGLYLLYGPSVAQVFASVADQSSTESALKLEKEFIRLMEI